MPRVEIYTQDWCPFCTRAIALLKAKGVAFEEIKAEAGTPERAKARERAGGLTSVPQIFIDGRHIGGCDALMALDCSGQLDPLLRAA